MNHPDKLLQRNVYEYFSGFVISWYFWTVILFITAYIYIYITLWERVKKIISTCTGERKPNLISGFNA